MHAARHTSAKVGARRLVLAALTTCALFAVAASSASAQTTGLTSFTNTPLSVSADTPGTVTVTAQLTNVPAGDGLTAYAAATPAAGDYREGTGSDLGDYMVTLNLVSGTDAAGTWSGSGPVRAGFTGTFTFDELSGYYSSSLPLISFDASQLASAGAQTFSTTATKIAANPTNISAHADLSLIDGSSSFGFTSANMIRATVDSYNANCGSTPNPSGSNIFLFGPKFGICTVKFHTWNSVGRSAEATASGLFL